MFSGSGIVVFGSLVTFTFVRPVHAFFVVGGDGLVAIVPPFIPWVGGLPVPERALSTFVLTVATVSGVDGLFFSPSERSHEGGEDVSVEAL